MRHLSTLLVMGVILGLTCTCMAQGKARSNTQTAEAAQSPEIAAIQVTETSFKKAFDAGDAQAVAAHWTVDGEYVDEGGRHLQGRQEIAKAYAEFFKANPGIQISTHVDQLRLVGTETAIEDGTAVTESSMTGRSGSSRYTVVHVKQNGKWLMASVRDARDETTVAGGHLADLSWLIGTWVSENEGVELEVKNRWIASNNFIEQSFEASRNGQSVSSGVQIIGWDPSTQNVKSWAFTSEGGRSVGVWTPHETGWIVESAGALRDGTPTTAVNLFSALDENGFSWRSVNRTAGEFRVLDTDEVIMRRQLAVQK